MEITRVRALINRITADLDSLPAAQRAGVDQAVAVGRRHRTVMLGMPRSSATGPLSSLPHRAGRDDQEQPA